MLCLLALSLNRPYHIFENVVKIPSEALTGYLKRPRSVREVAERFGISERLAISQLKEGVITGRISVIGSPLRLRASKSHPEWKQIPRALQVSRDTELIATVGFQTVGPRNLSLRLTGGRANRSPQFRPSTATPRLTSEIIPQRARPSMQRVKSRLTGNPQTSRQPSLKLTRKRRLLGPSDLRQILTHVKAHPATIARTREALAISGAELKRLLRTGLLKESWGRGGVGVTIRLSQEGLRQLSWMNEASKLDQRAKRALFVSLKQNYVPF